MPTHTRFLSRLIGLYCVIVSLSMATHRAGTIEAVNALIRNPSLLLITGVITLLAGLAMVLSHNSWSGGAVTVIVTLTGWIALFKGLLLISLSPQGEVGFIDGLHYEQYFYFYMAFMLVIGVWLTWAGFRRRFS